jgi:glycogen operon protein
MLATLLLSLGVPMLLGGDEIGRTQGGNNNAYCQDNATSWFDWASADSGLLGFTRKLVALRKRHPVLRRRRFLSGANPGDVRWFTPNGSDMTASDWQAGWTRSVVAYYDGVSDPDRDDRGRLMADDDLLMLVNGWSEALDFTLPDIGSPRDWRVEVDTFAGTVGGAGNSKKVGPALPAGSTVNIGPRSIVLLKAAAPGATPPPAPQA